MSYKLNGVADATPLYLTYVTTDILNNRAAGKLRVVSLKSGCTVKKGVVIIAVCKTLDVFKP